MFGPNKIQQSVEAQSNTSTCKIVPVYVVGVHILKNQF